MTENPYQSPSADLSGRDAERPDGHVKLALRAVQAAGVASIVYWGYHLAALIGNWGLYELQSQTMGAALSGPFPRLMGIGSAVIAGALVLWKSKWVFVPLALHVALYDGMMLSFVRWSWSILPGIYKLQFLGQVVVAALCVWLYRRRVLQ